MIEPRRTSPLCHRSPLAAADNLAAMSERAFEPKWVLRGAAETLAAPVRDALGLELPVQPCTSSLSAENTILWRSPDEWWLVGPLQGRNALANALAGQHHQLTDVSDYYTVIELSGAGARRLLAKLTPLDLHPKVFPVGAVAGTVLAKAAGLIHLPADDPPAGPVFHLIIRWSMADYLWCLLADAGREFGLEPQGPAAKVRLRG